MTKLELLTMTDGALDKAVKIQGTKYDRKRKLSDATIAKAKKLFSKGELVSDIARKLGVNYSSIRYQIDSDYRTAYNMRRSGAHTGKDHISKLDRIAYKRQLVAAGRVTA